MPEWDPFGDPADGPAHEGAVACGAAAKEWDPLGDPADGAGGGYQAGCAKAHTLSTAGAEDEGPPPDPWDDTTYVRLVGEAVQEAAAREAAAKALAAELAAKKAAEEARKAEERQRTGNERKAQQLREQRELKEKEDQAFQAELEVWEGSKMAYEDWLALQVQREEEAAREWSMSSVEWNLKLSRNFRKWSSQKVAKPETTTGLIFPDQTSRSLRLLRGAQYLPGVEGLPSVMDMLEYANYSFGFDILHGDGVKRAHEFFRGKEAIPTWLTETRLCQPTMYIAAIAGILRLEARRPGSVRKVLAAAGLSLGEYAALTFAGVFDFATGFRLVRARAEAMQEAAAAGAPQRMLSVAGLPRRAVEQLCEEARVDQADVCQVAYCLFPDGFVCAGSAAAVERLLAAARVAEGCKQVALIKCDGAFHTELMAPARQRLREALKEAEPDMRPPCCDVYMSACGRKIGPGTQPSEIVEMLADQLTSCVSWEETVRSMLRDGVGQFYECGPMQQLKGMMKRIDAGAHGSMLSVDHIVEGTYGKN